GRYCDAPPARTDDWTDLMVPAPLVCPLPEGGTEQSAPDAGPALEAEWPLPVEQPSSRPVASDLVLLDDDEEAPLPVSHGLRQLGPARLASLDPDDGISL